MQLWSNVNLSEFAIRFDSQFVVKTSENANFDIMIDESPINKYAALLHSKKVTKDKEFKLQIDEEDENSMSSHVSHIKSQTRHKRAPKPTLKCHFCNLKYCLGEERKDHEEFWHRDKLKSS